MSHFDFGALGGGNSSNKFEFGLPGNMSFNPTTCGNHTLTTITTISPHLVVSPGYVSTRIIIDVYIVGLLCIMGFIGNSLSIAVLYRDHDKKNTTNWLLQTLAVVDTVYLITCVFFQTLQTITEHTNWMPSLTELLAHMMPIVWAVASIAQTTTVWTVMLVTIDRYIAVCRPLKQHQRSIKRAQLAVAIVCILAVIYNIPRFFERQVTVTMVNCHRNIKSEKTAFRKNRLYFLIYKTIMYFMFRTIGPLLILIVLNCQLIKALSMMRQRHKEMTTCGKHRENITFMLVIVVTVFVICELPDLFLRILVTFYEFDLINLDIVKLRTANLITNMLLTVNSCVNFLIYCLVGKKFRKILMEMTACGKQMHINVDISETEPLTTRTNINLSKNGASTAVVKDGEVVIKDGEVATKDGDVCL